MSRSLSTVSHTDSVEALRDAIADAPSRRAYFGWNPETSAMETTLDSLQPIADWLTPHQDIVKHEGLFLEVASSGYILGAFVQNTTRGQACGGIRLRQYDNTAGYLLDGCRLATGMSRKLALCSSTSGQGDNSLWSGGGKGVIAATSSDDHLDPDFRRQLFEDYGNFLTSLQGCYVAAEDSGVFVSDLDVVYSNSRFTTCISPELGGSGNPSIPTAEGVVCGMEAALQHLGKGTLEGKTVAIQGLGNVGGPLVGFLLEKGVKHITAADVSEGRVAAALEEHGSSRLAARVVGPDDVSVLAEDCDIVSPCGFGGVLSASTIPTITAPIVCGAANNQLATVEDGEGLPFAYVPDFVTNRMGVVNCSIEAFGRIGTLGTSEDPLLGVHLDNDCPFGIFQTVKQVLERADAEGVSTNTAACELADEAMTRPNPILGGDRSRNIIKGLMDGGWASKAR